MITYPYIPQVSNLYGWRIAPCYSIPDHRVALYCVMFSFLRMNLAESEFDFHRHFHQYDGFLPIVGGKYAPVAQMGDCHLPFDTR
jgi:hypothetical protein